MADLGLPHRLIAAGEEPLGERVNVYNKMKTLRGIIDSLDQTEIQLIRDSPLGGLLDFPNKPAWSASFGLTLLSRQLDIAKSNEIWVVYAGTPVRFSLREFRLVTGLACGRYPAVPKKKRKGTAGKEIPFYSTLFGLETDVTVERVIIMLKKKVTDDPSLRIRYAVLALVDGYLLPTSHHPKIVKEHAEMSENLTSFLAYPWGRLSFEMMMNSIKERELEQLATTSVAVQGLLFALQLVVLQAVPAIQEGPVLEETIGSESDEEAVEIIPHQVVPFKLGNAKAIDVKCQAVVAPIICPEVVLDDGEDLSWSDDEVDPSVDKMVSLAEQGFKFNNDMFPGGCIPSQIVVAPKKQKRSAVLKGGRVMKGKKQGRNQRNPTGIRRSHQSPPIEEASASGSFDMNALSRLLDVKLNAHSKKIIKAVTDWFLANTVISAENGKEVQLSDNNPVGNSEDERGDSLFRRPSRRTKNAPASSQPPQRSFNSDGTIDAIADFYNVNYGGEFSGPRRNNDVGQSGNGDGVVADNNQTGNEVRSDFANDVELANDMVRKDPVEVPPHDVDGSNGDGVVTDNIQKPAKEVSTDGSPDGELGDGMDIEEPKPAKEVSTDGSPDGELGDGMDIEEPAEVPPPTVEGSSDISNGMAKDKTVEVPPPNVVESNELSNGMPSEKTVALHPPVVEESNDHCNGMATDETGSHQEVDSDSSTQSARSNQSISSPGDYADSESQGVSQLGSDPLHGSQIQVQPDVHVSNTQVVGQMGSEPLLAHVPSQSSVVGYPGGRKSKRLRTRSSKLDGRFQFDKKTKLLVGHPSPIATLSTRSIDPDERFNNSMKKLKAISSISLGDDVSIASKDIIDLIDRKKPLSNKVMDALLKFSRHILRTDDVDGEKLRVDLLDTKFISHLCRLFPKFSKAPVPEDFQFPKALIDAVAGVGELDRAQLFTEVDYLYLPFNFDKKHWVALVVELKCAKITVLDCNVHLRTDASLKMDLQPLATMLPFLFRQAACNPTMSQLLTSPFSIERSLCIPQVTAHVDSGLMSLFLIHGHAAGGMDDCVEFPPDSIDAETKKLVSALILAGVP